MNSFEHIPVGVDERTELLICRYLDGEISSAEQAELNRILAVNDAARALLDEYQHNDHVAMQALRQDAGVSATRNSTPTPTHRHRGWWTAIVSATLTAAAVIAISFIPSFLSSPTSSSPVALQQSKNARPSQAVPQINPQLVDYKRDMNYVPMQRNMDLHRDVIGVQGNSPNVIYLFERSRSSTKLTPVSGDF